MAPRGAMPCACSNCASVKSRPISGGDSRLLFQVQDCPPMTFDFAAARATMVDTQVRVNDVTDIDIQTAMKQVPRERHCADQTHMAYADAEVAYAPGRWLLRPRDAAKLLQSVRPRAGETALCIAAPYLADILEDMGLVVTRLNDGDLKAAPT